MVSERWDISHYKVLAQLEQCLHQTLGQFGIFDVCLSNTLHTAWVDVMMKDELEMIKEEKSPFWIGGVTYISFLAIGIIPLSVYVWDFFSPLEGNRFLWTCVFTALGFASIGWLKSRVNEVSILKGIAETLALGGVAAAVAFYVGYLLEQLVQ